MSKGKMKDPKDLDGIFFKLSSKDDDIVEILCKVKDRTTFIKNAMVYYYRALKQNPSLVERSIVIDEYDIPHIYMQQQQLYNNQSQFMSNMNGLSNIDFNNSQQEEITVDNQVDDTSNQDSEEEFNYSMNEDVDW